MADSLFRQQAIDAQSNRHLGSARFDVPPGAMFCAASLLSAFLIVGIFLGSANYARKYPVYGAFDERNAKEIIAPTLGHIARLDVTEGMSVSEGQLLGIIEGIQKPAIEEELEEQLEQIRNIRSLTNQRYEKQLKATRRSASSIEHQLRLTADDIRLQQLKVNSLEQQQAHNHELYQNGLISNLDWLNLETSCLTERQQLNQLRQQGLALRNQLSEVKQQEEVFQTEQNERQASLTLQASQLRQQLAEVQSNQSVELNAPITGRVSRVALNRGAAVKPGETVVYLTELDTAIEGSLYIPSKAAAHLKAGDKLQLEVDAYPATRHGYVSAEVVQLSNHTVRNKYGEDMFVARLTFDDLSHGNYLPGMNYSTFVRTEQKQLFAWLLDPFVQRIDILFG